MRRSPTRPSERRPGTAIGIHICRGNARSACRIEWASQHIPLDDLAIGLQCGFASVVEGNVITEADQWAKLRLVVETAREVWGHL
jgi:hypothetical protein